MENTVDVNYRMVFDQSAAGIAKEKQTIAFSRAFPQLATEEIFPTMKRGSAVLLDGKIELPEGCNIPKAILDIHQDAIHKWKKGHNHAPLFLEVSFTLAT